jgi:hypothetical protein
MHIILCDTASVIHVERSIGLALFVASRGSDDDHNDDKEEEEQDVFVCFVVIALLLLKQEIRCDLDVASGRL